MSDALNDSPLTYWAWRVTGWAMYLTGMAIITAGWTQGFWKGLGGTGCGLVILFMAMLVTGATRVKHERYEAKHER